MPRWSLTLASPERVLLLPKDVNPVIRGWLLSLLPSSQATYWHDHGLQGDDGGAYKPWVFGRLQGRFETRPEHLLRWMATDELPLTLEVSVVNEALADAWRTAFTSGTMQTWQGQRFYVTSLQDQPEPLWQHTRYRVRMDSPVILHQQVGTSQSVFVGPWTPPGRALLEGNLRSKLRVMGVPMEPQDLQNVKVTLEDADMLTIQSVTRQIRGSYVRGFLGTWTIEMPREWWSVAWHLGWGSRNGYGYGMWNVANPQKEGIV